MRMQMQSQRGDISTIPARSIPQPTHTVQHSNGAAPRRIQIQRSPFSCEILGVTQGPTSKILEDRQNLGLRSQFFSVCHMLSLNKFFINQLKYIVLNMNP
jgi:hypothetical protein